MRVSEAIKRGFQRTKYGTWRKKIKQKSKSGKIIMTWQNWDFVSKCITCGADNVSFHKVSRYCTKRCYRIEGQPFRLGKKFPNERGAYGNKRIASNGYVEVYLPGHPIADNRGRVLEHRLIIYDEIKRPLTFNDVVHHINGNRADNRRENLVLTTRSDHNSHHKTDESKERIRDRLGRFLP